MNTSAIPSVSVVTAPGRGAVAVVRVWGPRAVAVADSAFRPNRGQRLAESPTSRLRVGRMGAGQGDEVVAVVVEGEPPEVEIQCHGGPFPLAMVVEALEQGGARMRSPRSWVHRAAGSSIRAEASGAMATAPTVRTAEILLDQAEGALDEELRRVLDARSGSDLALLDTLIGRARVGVRLVEGWRVVLAGRPNVGKSRLLNALAGFDRAIVDPSPGTTRDAVTVASAFDGWPVEMTDTAGLRAPADPIEAEGVARARFLQRGADLVLIVLDRSEPLGDRDCDILAEYPETMIVANKVDLPAAWDEMTLGALAVSAERGDGVETLVGAIAARLVPDPPPPGAGVPFLPIQARRLTMIRDRLAGENRERARRSLARWLR